MRRASQLPPQDLPLRGSWVLRSSRPREGPGSMKTSARGKVSYTLRGYRHKPLANYEMLRRIRSSAPTPEDISARLANNVSVPTSGAPPLLGSTPAVALVVGVAVGVGGGPWAGRP